MSQNQNHSEDSALTGMRSHYLGDLLFFWFSVSVSKTHKLDKIISKFSPNVKVLKT